MMDPIKIFSTGELMMISTGEYSDYDIKGLFKILKDFDAQEQLAIWAKETGREVVNYRVESEYQNQQIDYMGWLNKNGFIEDVDYRELHTDDYGTTVLEEH